MYVAKQYTFHRSEDEYQAILCNDVSRRHYQAVARGVDGDPGSSD